MALFEFGVEREAMFDKFLTKFSLPLHPNWPFLGFRVESWFHPKWRFSAFGVEFWVLNF